MNILLIGATSFLGPAVISKLLDKGHSIYCFVRTDSRKEKIEDLKNIASLKNKADALSFITGNLFSSDSISGHLKGIEAVVCLIDLKHTDFIKNILSAINNSPLKRAVFISSTTVLVPFASDVKNAKILSENLIRHSGLEFTILRPTMIYGSADDKNYSKMISFIKKRGFFIVFGKGNNLIQPVFIEDVAAAVRDVLENPSTFKKVYEICGKNPMRYKEMLNTLKSKLKEPYRIIYLPARLSKFFVSIYSKLFPASGLKPDMIERMEIDKAYSFENASADFGYLPLPFETGIEKLIKELEKK